MSPPDAGPQGTILVVSCLRSGSCVYKPSSRFNNREALDAVAEHELVCFTRLEVTSNCISSTICSRFLSSVEQEKEAVRRSYIYMYSPVLNVIATAQRPCTQRFYLLQRVVMLGPTKTRLCITTKCSKLCDQSLQAHWQTAQLDMLASQKLVQTVDRSDCGSALPHLEVPRAFHRLPRIHHQATGDSITGDA